MKVPVIAYVCVYCIVVRLVEWLGRQSRGRERGVGHDEHVAGEVAAMASKLEQKEAELRGVSEK